MTVSVPLPSSFHLPYIFAHYLLCVTRHPAGLYPPPNP
jgi:hypothetical protein